MSDHDGQAQGSTASDLERLRRAVVALERRVESLEWAMKPARPAIRVEPFGPVEPEQHQPLDAGGASAEPAVVPLPPIAQPAPAPPVAASPAQRRVTPPPLRSQTPLPAGSLEATIGKNWTGWIGAIVFVLGVLFFLKYAWDQGWINPTPTMRVVAAIAAGLVLNALGERMHFRKLKALAAIFHGAGLAIVLASFFGAYALFDPERRVLSVSGAFTGVVITAAIGVGLALHINAIVLALIAMIGAYIAPFVLNTGADRTAELLAYLGVLAAVAWALSYLKPRWLAVRKLAWIGTMGTVAACALNDTLAAHRTVATFWIAIYAAGFLLEMILTLRKCESSLSRGWRASLDTGTALLSLLNTAATCVLLRSLYDTPRYDVMLGAVAVLVAAIHGAAAFATGFRGFSISSLLQSAALVTLAVPLILDQFSITLAWLALAVALAVLARELNLPAARGWALVLLLLALGRMVISDGRTRSVILLDTPFIRISQWMFMAWGAAVLAHVIAWLRPGEPGRFPLLEARLARIVPAIPQWTPIPQARASAGVIDYAQPAPAATPDRPDPFGIFISIIGTLVFVGATATTYERSMLTLLGLLWLGGLVALAVRGRALRYTRHALFVAALIGLKWFAVDGMEPIIRHWDHPRVETILAPVANPVAANSVILCVILAGLIVQLRRSNPQNLPLQRALMVWIGLLLLVTLNFEACRTVDWMVTHGVSMRDAGIVKHGVMSVLWALVGFAAVIIGFRRKILPLRVAALVLLGATLLKILLIDMAEVAAVWRILSFVAVGGLLLAVSYVYHQQMQGRREQSA